MTPSNAKNRRQKKGKYLIQKYPKTFIKKTLEVKVPVSAEFESVFQLWALLLLMHCGSVLSIDTTFKNLPILVCMLSFLNVSLFVYVLWTHCKLYAACSCVTAWVTDLHTNPWSSQSPSFPPRIRSRSGRSPPAALAGSEWKRKLHRSPRQTMLQQRRHTGQSVTLSYIIRTVCIGCHDLSYQKFQI